MFVENPTYFIATKVIENDSKMSAITGTSLILNNLLGTVLYCVYYSD